MLIPSALRFGSIKIYDHTIYFEESRPHLGGKNFLLAYNPKTDSSPREVLPENVELRTKINEYGGCSFEVAKEGIYFIEKSSNQVWLYTHDQKLKQITHSPHRYAELLWTPHGLIAVEEKAYAEKTSSTLQRLVLILIREDELGKIISLHSGADFYSNPACYGNHVSFLSWSHPHMPWNENNLWLGVLTEGGLKEPRIISTGKNLSHFGPQFLQTGELLFSSDQTGFWNLTIYHNGKITPLHTMALEIGYPQWVFGLSCFSAMKERIQWIGCDKAIWKKGSLDLNTKAIEHENFPMTYFAAQSSSTLVEAWIESSHEHPQQIVCRLEKSDKRVIRKSLEGNFPTYPAPESLQATFSNREIQGFYYRQENTKQTPLLIRCHGGPTGMSSTSYDPKIAFWLSKGFAVFDINYTGSAGFGREFRDRLNGHWGEYDWKDCEHWAEEFIRRELTSQEALFISGSSAGGFTALCAAARSKLFAGAASYYGISDLVTLHKTTHRFESHYDQTLIGRFSESKKLYEKRSPIHYLDEWQTPILFLQGEEDKVVPKDQSLTLYDELQKRGVRTEIKIYSEEGHGFRKYENQRDALEREWRFYQEILLSKKPSSKTH